MPNFETAWTRTRILVEAKMRARIVARLLDWNVPGVEAAILNYVLLEYDPEVLAMDIREALVAESEGQYDSLAELPVRPDAAMEIDDDPTREIPALPD